MERRGEELDVARWRRKGCSSPSIAEQGRLGLMVEVRGQRTEREAPKEQSRGGGSRRRWEFKLKENGEGSRINGAFDCLRPQTMKRVRIKTPLLTCPKQIYPRSSYYR